MFRKNKLSPVLMCVIFLFFCGISEKVSGLDWDLFSDTWVATDGLGRTLPGQSECGPVKRDKFVGIFYWTWHTMNSRRGPFDNTKIIAANPDNPQWGPIGAAHHWGEPELGYYISTDPYVIRRHASMLAEAGVDVIIFDTTNPPFTFKKSYTALCKEYQKMRQEGNRTPQIAFLCPFWDPQGVVNTIYADLYKPGLYRHLWFQWKGKPLIMADPQKIQNPAIRTFFTFRKPIPSYFTGPSGPDQWGWLEVYPQHGFYDSQGKIEQVTVGIAQNAVGNKLSMMSHRAGAMGRSWHAGHRDMRSGAVNQGYNVIEQWQRALKLDPEFIFITGWNEWVAGRFTKWNGYTGKDSYYPDALFVDEYTQEYSRDIEPMKGGHYDNYYYQMVAYIRKFKGVHKIPRAAGENTIAIDGDFTDWSSVQPEFRDTIGDTAHRDHRGYGQTHYVNNTGRNDMVASKVAYDKANIYFYVKTRARITPYTDKNWMLLFIDSDLNHNTGWQGYDFLVNGSVAGPNRTTIQHIDKKGEGGKAISLAYRVKGDEMELAVPRQILHLQNKADIVFDFHWADNIQKRFDIAEFALSGDSAPDRRFNYRFISGGTGMDTHHD